ncbi:hypothetical protein AYJ01_10520 [Shewanella algae]|nr:hypothetical protein AYJ01_10520 [Shewanella algae]
MWVGLTVTGLFGNLLVIAMAFETGGFCCRTFGGTQVTGFTVLFLIHEGVVAAAFAGAGHLGQFAGPGLARQQGAHQQG